MKNTPGPLGPPVRIRPSRKMTDFSYSWPDIFIHTSCTVCFSGNPNEKPIQTSLSQKYVLTSIWISDRFSFPCLIPRYFNLISTWTTLMTYFHVPFQYYFRFISHLDHFDARFSFTDPILFKVHFSPGPLWWHSRERRAGWRPRGEPTPFFFFMKLKWKK